MAHKSSLPVAFACGLWLAVLPLDGQQNANGDAAGPAPRQNGNVNEFCGLVPFAKDFIKDLLHDQRDIWTSPFHMSHKNAATWILMGAGAAALLAADHPIWKALPHTGTPVNVGNDLSRIGNGYTVYPLAAALYGSGWLTHDEKLRETGILSAEALTDADIVVGVTKVIARRQRPIDGAHGGHFEKGGAAFPSGHSAQAWALASVVAVEYGDRKWIPVLSYTYATSVSIARVLSQQHFTSDVFVGSAVGFFIGRYVVRANAQRHRGAQPCRATLLPSVQPDFGPKRQISPACLDLLIRTPSLSRTFPERSRS